MLMEMNSQGRFFYVIVVIDAESCEGPVISDVKLTSMNMSIVM